MVIYINNLIVICLVKALNSLILNISKWNVFSPIQSQFLQSSPDKKCLFNDYDLQIGLIGSKGCLFDKGCKIKQRTI